jgi:hypothetical protein
MANPNIVNVSSIYGKTTFLTPSVTTPVVLVNNATGSSSILKTNNIMVSNVDGSNSISATVALYSNGAVAQGSAPSGGTSYPLIFNVSIPAGSSLTVLDKSIYLEENMSIVVTSGTISKINYVVSYEIIS